MLTCREVAERAEDWLDRDLDKWQTLQMRLHLAMCKGCNRFINQMCLTRDLTQTAGDEDITDLRQGDDQQIDAIFSRLHEKKQSEG